MKKIAVRLISLTGILFLCSCSSIFTSRSIKEPMMNAYLAGNMQEAERIADEYASSREGSGDELMWRLEQGKIKFDMGRFKESLESFEKAEKLVLDFDERAKISAREAGAETGAAFTNQNALPYKGFMYDRILLNAYKSLCYLALGDKAGAMVEIRRMHQRQKDAKEYFDAEIRRSQEEIKEKQAEMSKHAESSSGEYDKILEANPDIKKSHDEVNSMAKKIYGDFVNPFSLYLSAINYLLDHDYNSANVDFRNLYAANSTSKLVSSDFATASQRIGATGNLPEELKPQKTWDYPLDKNIVFVIFENGISAAFKEQKVQIILPPPIPTGYSGIAFPVLEEFPQPFDGLKIEAGGKTYISSEVSDMDSVVGSEFKEIFPQIITRLVVSTIIKEGGAFVAQMAAEQAGGEFAKWGTVVATSIYKYAFNTADTRCWQTLPKKYMIAHLPKPSNGIISLSAGLRSETVKLSEEKSFALVYVRAQSQDQLSVKVFEF